MNKYHTFWARFWAGIVDGFVLCPISFLNPYFSSPHRGSVVLITWTILFSCSYWIYSVTLIAKRGQTVGKRVAGTQVLDVSEGRIPTLRQAVLRDIGNIVPSSIQMIFMIYLILAHLYSAESISSSQFLSVLGYAGGIWFLLEITTMFLNEKRRAFHDLIAGTVVVHTSYAPVTIGLGLSDSTANTTDLK
jgi:uncharacterized RDD family membrane protein YckC